MRTRRCFTCGRWYKGALEPRPAAIKLRALVSYWRWLLYSRMPNAWRYTSDFLLGMAAFFVIMGIARML
jgi:hypothetical protein